MKYLIYLGASAFTGEQMSSVSGALTQSANTILDTFIGLLPIIALIVGVSFGITFVTRRFNKLEHKKA